MRPDFARWMEKLAAAGAAMSALGCASCFPALGALGAGLGLGSLARFEGLFVNILVPAFAGMAFAVYAWLFWRKRGRWLPLLGMLSAGMILATFEFFWSAPWSTPLFYTGLGILVAVAGADVATSIAGRCGIRRVRDPGEFTQ